MKITKNNFKSPHIYILYSLFILLGLGLLVYHFYTSNLEFLYISGGIFTFLIFLSFMGFMTKIHIERKGVTQTSISKDYLLNWNDIKTIGVYRVNKYETKIVEAEKYDTFSLLGQKFIYVSTEKNYIPKRNQNTSSDFIHFHYRKEAWKGITKSSFYDITGY